MLKLMEERYKMYLGLSTYNVRIQSLCKLKRSAEAKVLMEGMICRGMKLSSSNSHFIHGMICRGTQNDVV